MATVRAEADGTTDEARQMRASFERVDEGAMVLEICVIGLQVTRSTWSNKIRLI